MPSLHQTLSISVTNQLFHCGIKFFTEFLKQIERFKRGHSATCAMLSAWLTQSATQSLLNEFIFYSTKQNLRDWKHIGLSVGKPRNQAPLPALKASGNWLSSHSWLPPRKLLVTTLRTVFLSLNLKLTVHLGNVYRKSYVEIGRYLSGKSLHLEEVFCNFLPSFACNSLQVVSHSGNCSKCLLRAPASLIPELTLHWVTVCRKLIIYLQVQIKNKHITLSARSGKGKEINIKCIGKCILYLEIQTETSHRSNSDISFSERKVSAAILSEIFNV